jgi:hypothetical protein
LTEITRRPSASVRPIVDPDVTDIQASIGFTTPAIVEHQPFEW